MTTNRGWSPGDSVVIHGSSIWLRIQFSRSNRDGTGTPQVVVLADEYALSSDHKCQKMVGHEQSDKIKKKLHL